MHHVAGLALTLGAACIPAQVRPPEVVSGEPAPIPVTAVAEPVVAWVDGASIGSREFRLFVARHRAATIAHFQRRHGVDDLVGFWSVAIDGVTPLAFLHERALRECVRHRIERRLAVGQGVIARADYAFVVEQLEQENQRRREVIAAGGPVFGPRLYTETTWYRYFFSNVVLRTKAKLAATTLRPSEDAITAERVARAAEFGRAASEPEVRQFLLREQIDRAYERTIDELVAGACVRVDEETIQRLEIQ